MRRACGLAMRHIQTERCHTWRLCHIKRNKLGKNKRHIQVKSRDAIYDVSTVTLKTLIENPIIFFYGINSEIDLNV